MVNYVHDMEGWEAKNVFYESMCMVILREVLRWELIIGTEQPFLQEA